MDTWSLLHGVLAYFALTMALLSLWVKPSVWIWATFLIFAFVLGYFAKIIEPFALLPIGGLFILHAVLKGNRHGFSRFALDVLTFLLSYGLLSHKFLGFSYWKILGPVQLSQNAALTVLSLSFAPFFVGFFVLALSVPLLQSGQKFFRSLSATIPLTILSVIVLIGLALFLHQVEWDPKLSFALVPFLFQNLIFVCIVQEAFWRGFVQNELCLWLGSTGPLAPFFSILLTSSLFTLLLLPVSAPIDLLFPFVTNLLYGAIYQTTKNIESSIFCHFSFNLTHFLFFTYPYLLPSLS